MTNQNNNLKRVLITGGAGFIGSHVADNLFATGEYQIRILDNLSPKTHNGEWPSYLKDDYEKFFGDVCNPNDMLNALKGIDFVIHLAAEMDLNPDYSRFISSNVTSTALIYELINKHKLPVQKVLLASTQFVYGSGLWQDKNGEEIINPSGRKEEEGIWDHYKDNRKLKYLKCKENQALAPPNHYALSKFFAEQFALKIGQLSMIPTNILRYSIIHGPRQSIKNTYSGALRTFCYFASLNKRFSSFEDNLSLRDFTSIFDAAEATCLVLKKAVPFEIYNISNGQGITIKKLAQMVSDGFNKPLEFETKIEWRHGDIRHAVSCNQKLIELGYKSICSEERAVKLYIDWFKQQELDYDKFNETQKIIRENGQIRTLKKIN